MAAKETSSSPNKCVGHLRNQYYAVFAGLCLIFSSISNQIKHGLISFHYSESHCVLSWMSCIMGCSHIAFIEINWHTTHHWATIIGRTFMDSFDWSAWKYDSCIASTFINESYRMQTLDDHLFGHFIHRKHCANCIERFSQAINVRTVNLDLLVVTRIWQNKIWNFDCETFVWWHWCWKWFGHIIIRNGNCG